MVAVEVSHDKGHSCTGCCRGPVLNQGSCHYDQHAAKHPELNYGHEDVGGVITLAVPRYPCAIAGRPIQGALHNLLLPIMQEAHAVCEAAGQCPGGDTGSKSDHKLGQRVACVPIYLLPTISALVQLVNIKLVLQGLVVQRLADPVRGGPPCSEYPGEKGSSRTVGGPWRWVQGCWFLVLISEGGHSKDAQVVTSIFSFHLL
mmetsp:Transcript_28671/g.77299  ORF Transcript_28671/g.77299 Transcript_28671/m.77299 type:complete len:202 (+) Transcript_28671:1754-2359(+)